MRPRATPSAAATSRPSATPTWPPSCRCAAQQGPCVAQQLRKLLRACARGTQQRAANLRWRAARVFFTAAAAPAPPARCRSWWPPLWRCWRAATTCCPRPRAPRQWCVALGPFAAARVSRAALGLLCKAVAGMGQPQHPCTCQTSMLSQGFPLWFSSLSVAGARAARRAAAAAAGRGDGPQRVRDGRGGAGAACCLAAARWFVLCCVLRLPWPLAFLCGLA